MKSLSFGADGQIAHQVVGPLDQENYQIQMTDLEEFVNERVEEYCAENGEQKVVLEAAEEKGGSIVLNFRYA